MMGAIYAIFCWISNPDNLTAISTLTIAAFTIVLAIVGYWQARLIRKSINLAREEFISTHRPRIILRDVCMEGREILYMLVNSGGTEATIMESWIIAEYVPPNRSKRNLRSYGHDDLGRLTFAAGEMKDLAFVFEGIGSYSQNMAGDLYFAGAILYSDAADNRRRSVFRRRWDHGRQDFYRTDDPDQEYAD